MITAFMLSVWGVSFGDTPHTDSVGAFRRIMLYGNVDVTCRIATDSVGVIRYTEPADMDKFIISNNDGALMIQTVAELGNEPSLSPLEVYTDTLVSVENSYDGELRISGTVVTDYFKARQQGNGSIAIDTLRATEVKLAVTTGRGVIDVASGECGSLSCRITGAGAIDAVGLRSDRVACRFLGSGEIKCSPVDTLSIFGIGSTKVYYTRSPRIRKFWNKCRKIE